MLVLCQRPQTARAYLDFANLAPFDDRGLLDVGSELAVGVSHRVADVVTELRCLATDFALCH